MRIDLRRTFAPLPSAIALVFLLSFGTAAPILADGASIDASFDPSTRTITVVGTGLNPNHANDGRYYIKFFGPDGAPVHTSPPIKSSPEWKISYTYELEPGYPTGDWTIRVYCAAHDKDGEGHGGSTTVRVYPLLRDVIVSISPSYQSAPSEATMDYTVTVANLGNVEDTYSLSASDALGWQLELSQSSLAIQPGQSAQVTLSVTVPPSTAGCTEDEVTVVATSAGDPTVSDSATCVAHAAILRGVSVAISPSHQSGQRGATLTYTVTVKNEGNVPDNYALTASDNAGWSPTISQGSLTLAAGQEAEVALSVTIPGGAADNEEDLIGVVATSEADHSVSDSASCIAQAAAAPPPPPPPSTPPPPPPPPAAQVSRGVSVLISPGSATGPPGGALTYVAIVINLGNVEDTFTLSAIGEAGWRASISAGMLTLGAGERGEVTLTVEVDAYAPAGASVTVEVIARSTSDPSVSASAQAIATASSAGSTNTGAIVPTAGWGAPPPPPVVPLATSAVSSVAIVLLSLYLLRTPRARGRARKGARRRRRGR